MGWLDELTSTDNAAFSIIRSVPGRIGNQASNAWAAVTEPRNVSINDTDSWQGSLTRGVSDTLDFAFGEGSLGQAALGMFTGDAYRNTPAPAYQAPSFQSRVVPETVVDENAGKGPNWDRSSGFRGAAANASYFAGQDLMAQLESERAFMQARRNAAVSAAGRGAGAGYNAAIARLDTELAKAKEQLGRIDPLFDTKRANQKLAWDTAGAELQVSADEALGEMQLINKQTYNAMSAQWTQAQGAAADVLGKIGADDATKAAVAAEVGRFEDEIMDMNEIDAVGASRILQASEDLAVASAKAAGANSNLELVRNQILVESDFKEKINGMIEDRKQQVRARNAAVSAARALEAARWPADQPLDRNGFASRATGEVIGKLMGSAPDGVRAQVEQLVGLFSEMGVRRSEVPKILAGNENLIRRYGLDGIVNFAALPASVISHGLRVIPVALDTFTTSTSWYDTNVAGQDPWALPAGSATQAMAAAERSGLSDPEDRMYAGREYADMAEQGRDLSQINTLMGANSTISSMSYDDRIAGNRARAGLS